MLRGAKRSRSTYHGQAPVDVGVGVSVFEACILGVVVAGEVKTIEPTAAKVQNRPAVSVEDGRP